MARTEIKIYDKESETEELVTIDTDGFLLLYLSNEKIKMTGKMDMRTLAPILTKLALERMSR